MKFFGTIIFLCLISITGKSQYYFNDIVAAQQSQKQYLALKTNHIHNVNAVSYESDNEPTEDFKLEQQIGFNAKTIRIFSSDPSSGSTVTINTYENNKLIKTIDSSINVTNTITYKYDASDKINTIKTVTEDTFMKSNSEELHQWFYKDDKPDYMLRIKDKTDTTLIALTYDEQGNVAQEDWKKKDRIIETYYYYYNDKKQLTDIVRYNNRAKKMLPDFLYEYDDEGHVIQLTEIPAGSSDYMIWKYIYANNGLKKAEYLFNKQKQLVGKIEYQYQ
ncbi:MAG: hypothetical protein ACR2FN_02435 [Chitinophagaceae bacterium]